MSNVNDSVSEENSFGYTILTIPSNIEFWVYFISNILSLLPCVFALSQFLIDRELRQPLNNHCTMVLLVIVLILELIDVPLMLQYYYHDTKWEPTPILSLFWTFIDYYLYTAQAMICAWMTIERHILIFHSGWLSTRIKRLFIHYIPLFTILIYCFIYYGIIIFIPFCNNTIYSPIFNGISLPCIYDNITVKKFDLIFNQIMPPFFIVIFSIALLLRVLWKKTRLRRSIQWRRVRKMVIQLLSITILHLVLSMSWACILLLQLLDVQLLSIIDYYIAYVYFFGYYIIFLLPFVICGSLPDLKMRLKKLFCCQLCQQQGRILPIRG